MNESEDFLSVVLQSYITAAAMQILEMKQVNEWPSSIPKDIWTEQDDVRAKVMESVLSSIVDRFLNIRYNSPHPIPSNGDQVLAYTKALFTMPSLYLEFADSIKEGDGDRVHRCWKYFAIIFHNSNRKNYAFEAVHLLYQLKYKLSPQQVEQVLYGRFINHVGSPGRNISADLHMEHLNRELKSCISSGFGKTEKGILRLGKALGTIAPVLHQFDEAVSVTHHQTRHQSNGLSIDLLKIVEDLNDYKVFKNIPGRKSNSYPKMKSLLHKKEESEILQWMKTIIN